MDAVCVEALVNVSCCFDKDRDRLVRDDDVNRSYGLALVEAPNVEFMHRLDPRNLKEAFISHCSPLLAIRLDG